MNRKMIEIFEEYQKGGLDRRTFMKKLSILAGGSTAAFTLLSLLEVNHAHAQIVPEDDPRLDMQFITYPGEDCEMKAYLARPKGDEKLPGVIVIHENRGLVPHIRDVTRRMALEGFLTLAPDANSPLGGTPEDENESRERMRQLDNEATVKNFVAAVQYLKTHPQSTGKVGCTGFCWGGSMTNQVAVNSPDLIAAVPYYGGQPAAEDVPKIRAAMLLHYGGEDERINAGIPAFEEALKAASIEYTIYVYEGAGHAFNNDTGTRYHEEAAKLAWERTVAFFKEKLKT